MMPLLVDHHFHYGYILYASAIMARVSSTFIDEFGPHVDALFHDVAHYMNGDSQAVSSSSLFFPLARHKSWFDGHSWATGMFPFGDGKSQESSSEAVNCYYGVSLWALIRHGSVSGASELVDFTRLLLAMEIRSAKTYWHMVPPDSAATNRTVTTEPYNADFRENYMVGNVGMLDVVASTWFGSDPLFVHMINVLPLTAATAALFEKEYVSKEYPYLLSSRSDVEMAWKGYTTSIHAIVDPNKAWEDAQGLVSYELDSALSKSQVLYWISNRPGFNVTVSMPEEPAPSSNSGGTKGSSTSSRSTGGPCEDNIGCAPLDLTGFCCPTLEGIMLGCCT
jgi:endo-1,3(4)-beta-glucanase